MCKLAVYTSVAQHHTPHAVRCAPLSQEGEREGPVWSGSPEGMAVHQAAGVPCAISRTVGTLHSLLLLRGFALRGQPTQLHKQAANTSAALVWRGVGRGSVGSVYAREKRKIGPD
jgi:hypothetical protein